MHYRTRERRQPRQAEDGERHTRQFGRGPRRERGERQERHAGRRARRGEARFLLLDALRDGPKHGYEIIKTLEERSAGNYAPSPGTVYPTLQLLEDQGLVRADQEAERRVYRLTAAGEAELATHAEELEAFWGRFAPRSTPGNSRHEVSFLKDELADLNRTVWSGLREAIKLGDQELIRRVRLAVEECQNEIRRIIATPDETPDSASGSDA